ncbi:hypothetical protein SAMN05444161_5565 [Rhizobiales bacterium GAS191]|nr:hypothetical protein SAMN05444161_5565 [Rhizobiales bacterium GAS191]
MSYLLVRVLCPYSIYLRCLGVAGFFCVGISTTSTSCNGDC